MPYTSVDNYNPITSKSQCCEDKLFATGRVENNKDFPLLYLLNVQRKPLK